MNNVILSMLAKISKMDAQAKQLAARVEAQSLMMSALLFTIGQSGGINELIGSVNKAINSVRVDLNDPCQAETELLLQEFEDMVKVSQLIARENDVLNTGDAGPFETKTT
ncbi:MAG: anti-adapter protein IraP [Enterobacterales bacterium endosymbiont of Blomia tropicalis]|uniref:anti-adapter protein IraP n=1 Tax=Mixta mediterraneensis TaxID=2758443 RepID=UPI001876EB17|nr:anti-adapter protein IraP [Mixta mediterraneensis]MBE5251787.1 anti-adapter protein IraP [Mixta mediterraneensis]MDL4912408.1 anti-adapter protein IraP [Mixta mediterraneensis]